MFCNHTGKYRKLHSSIQNPSCPICLNDFKNTDKVTILKCKNSHALHKTCKKSLLKSDYPRCPYDSVDLRSMPRKHWDTLQANRQARQSARRDIRLRPEPFNIELSQEQRSHYERLRIERQARRLSHAR